MVKIPSCLIAGDSLTVSVNTSLTGDCKMAITNAENIYTSVGEVAPSGFLITFNSASTQAFKVGQYRYHITITDSGERTTLQVGEIEIKPDITASNFDARTHAQIVLDAIEATLEKKATSDQENMSINGRSIQRYTFESLLVLRDKYRAQVATERRKQALANGEINKAFIKTRFR